MDSNVEISAERDLKRLTAGPKFDNRPVYSPDEPSLSQVVVDRSKPQIFAEERGSDLR